LNLGRAIISLIGSNAKERFEPEAFFCKLYGQNRPRQHENNAIQAYKENMVPFIRQAISAGIWGGGDRGL